MSDINKLKSLCGCYLINKQELENKENFKNNAGVYAIKNSIIKEQIEYVDSELKWIKEHLGELAYTIFYECYVKHNSITSLQKKLGYSKSDIYRKLSIWIEKYEDK